MLAGRAALGLIFLIWARPGTSVCPLAPVPARVRRNRVEEGTGESHWQRPFACPDREQGIFDGGLRTVSTEKALGLGRRREIFFLISHFGCLRVFCSLNLGYTFSAGLRGKLTGQETGVLLEKLFFMEFYVNASAFPAPLEVLRTTPKWAVGPTNIRQGRQADRHQTAQHKNTQGCSHQLSPELQSSTSMSHTDFFSSTKNAALMLLGPERLFKAGSSLCSWHPRLALRGRTQKALCGAYFFPALFALTNY